MQLRRNCKSGLAEISNGQQLPPQERHFWSFNHSGKRRIRQRHMLYATTWTMMIIFGIAFISGSNLLNTKLRISINPRSRSLSQLETSNYMNTSLSAWDFESDSHPVQVIQTRFMQFQANLLALGEARLEIFEAFCLPSILQQSSNKYLWIIRTDPDLHPQLKDSLLDMLRPYPNILLIGSNENPEGFRQASAVADIVPGTSLWTGSYELLNHFYAESQNRVLIETRLDADDGLHFDFVQYAQFTSMNIMADAAQDEWIVYCAHQHLEWHYANPFKTYSKSHDAGFIVGLQLGGCITPGLSFVYGLDIRRSDMPTGAHSHLHKITPFCNETLKSKCILRTRELVPAAIRARTPTSAGMANVVVGNRRKNLGYRPSENDAKYQDEIWIRVRRTFGIDQAFIAKLRRSMKEHLVEIAADNLKGQCTKGHSCKENSKQILKELVLYAATAKQ
jgi:Putative rhamnosyl transferase